MRLLKPAVCPGAAPQENFTNLSEPSAIICKGSRLFFARRVNMDLIDELCKRDIELFQRFIAGRFKFSADGYIWTTAEDIRLAQERIAEIAPSLSSQ